MTTERPYTLIAELTYRCPLRCVYCANALQVDSAELGTESWVRAIHEAESLGVVQINFTGGEPLLRDDLEELIATARAHDLYTNLITSGVPLDYDRLARLRDSGLDSVQLSFQGTTSAESKHIAGVATFEHKLVAADLVKRLDLPLTVNVVLHRNNLDGLEHIIELAEQLEADRLELANTQYLGWALLNRRALLPSREQLERAQATAADAKDRLNGRMDIIFVLPDYYSDFPKRCMDGWGRRYIVISADGRVLPCHLAQSLPDMAFDKITERPLREIWEQSELFNRFRGESWMPPTCRACERRSVDFGGCRCQAFFLTGDAAAVDPVCKFSSDHASIQQARAEAEVGDLVIPFHYRRLNKRL